MAFGAATTKETSAAAMFGYLLAVAYAYRGTEGYTYWKIVAGSGVVLAALVTPLLLADKQSPHDFNAAATSFEWSRLGYMFLHNATQVFYVTSAVGCGLVATFGLGQQLQRYGALLVLIGLLLCPPLRIYNHYESVIIDQIFWVFPFAVVLILSLFRIAQSKRTAPEHAILAGMVIMLGGVLVLAPVVALQSRPDVSARLYAPIIPAVLTLAWLGARQLRDSAGAVLSTSGHSIYWATGLVSNRWRNQRN